jgi:ABC-2 type transport system ATP-binding protein
LPNAVIQVSDLVKTYGSLKAVDHISFEVFEGEVFAFLGPNGAGKTTTIEILQTLRDPTSGSVRVLGHDISVESEAAKVKRSMGVLPQDFNSLERLTVKENLEFYASMYDQHREVGELIRLLDLEEYAKVKFKELSGGLKQRVGIAASLINDPDIVFLDEPTTGLDPRSRREVWEVIRGLREAGKAVFLTSHYMEEAEELADRIAIINRGRIAAIDAPHALLEKYGGNRTVLVEEMPRELAMELTHRFAGAHYIGKELAIEVTSASQIGTIIEAASGMGRDGDITIRNPTIEDVFLRLIGSKIADGGELS